MLAARAFGPCLGQSGLGRRNGVLSRAVLQRRWRCQPSLQMAVATRLVSRRRLHRLITHAEHREIEGLDDHCTSDDQLGALRAPPSNAKEPWPRLATMALKALGAAVLMFAAASAGGRPAYASTSRSSASVRTATVVPTTSTTEQQQRHGQQEPQQQHAERRGSWRYSGVDLVDSSGTPSSSGRGSVEDTWRGGRLGRAKLSRRQVEDAIRVDPELQRLVAAKRAAFYARHPGAEQSGLLARDMHERIGVPLDFDDIMRSMVPDPQIIPPRHTRGEIYELIDAMLNQYDNEDFDLGIKQFMIEQAVQQEMEEGLDKKGDAKDFEEKLAEQLFADEDDGDKKQLKTEDIADDAFTTEVAEEAIALMGEPNSLSTAWRVQKNLTELSYTQFWYLVSEGSVERVRYFGPERKSLMASISHTAPGGARMVKVNLPPDPALVEHLVTHGVAVEAGQTESERVGRAFFIQVARYTFPFVFISAVFWLLHTWILDPVPNKFRRREFIRYRREILNVGTKLNFRSPARQVFIDTTSPSFIGWDDINGIDDVKNEIEEIIDYLKNPALLRLRGVSRIGGVLLAGAPGTGKTLLARAVAAESGVKMFTCSGTDFYDVYTGVGARRIRETFDKLRQNAPAILFVDEFDALGAARGAAASGDESASIINELLVQMDGFEDNRGIVVLGATNRPGAIDSALIRPGRFDRIIYMPLPDAEGRAKILQVHCRGKAVDSNINWYEVARAMAGFTGADCMGLMQRAARMAARQGRPMITEEDIYAALENKGIESFQELTHSPIPGNDGVPDPIPHNLKKAVAVYEASKALLGYITPEYDEIARVSICPFNIITGYTLFVEDEERNADAILTRGDMEAHMVVNMAGRCGEKLVLGESEVTGLGAPDMFHANVIAREMVLSAGMNSKLGPMDLMKIKATQRDTGNLLRSPDPDAQNEQEYYYHATDMSTEESRVAMAEVIELLEAAEAKAYYGLSINWGPLNALVDALLDRGVLQGREVSHVLETAGVIHFPDPYIVGFGWDQHGELQYPFKPEGAPRQPQEQQGEEGLRELVGVAAKTFFAGTEQDAPRDKDGKFKYGFHWNSPYTVRKDVPGWYMKEVERYSY